MEHVKENKPMGFAVAKFCQRFPADTPEKKKKTSLFAECLHLTESEAAELLALTNKKEAAKVIYAAFCLQELAQSLLSEEGICDCCFVAKTGIDIQSRKFTGNASIYTADAGPDGYQLTVKDPQPLFQCGQERVSVATAASNFESTAAQLPEQVNAANKPYLKNPNLISKECGDAAAGEGPPDTSVLAGLSQEAEVTRCCCGVWQKRQIYGMACLLQLFLCAWEFAKFSNFRPKELSCTISLLRLLLPQILDRQMTHVLARDIVHEELLRHSIFRPPLSTNVFSIRTLPLVEGFFMEHVIMNLSALKNLFCPPRELHTQQPPVVEQRSSSLLLQQMGATSEEGQDD